MKLCEMSYVYREDYLRFKARIKDLKEQTKTAETKTERHILQRRIAELKVLAQQSRELAELTLHYYERGYRRDERYTL